MSDVTRNDVTARNAAVSNAAVSDIPTNDAPLTYSQANSSGYEPGDEISVRDLYLILRRGLPLILISALLAGALTFAVSSFLQTLYEAQSTTLIAISPLKINSTQNLTFSPPNEVSFEAYETLAKSRAVLETAVAAVPEAELASDDLSGGVELLIGPQQPGQVVPLSVQHSVRHPDPELASRLADAWAQSTVEAVQTSLLASLEPVQAATRQEIGRLRGDLETVEEELETFQRRDAGENLTDLLARLTERISATQIRRDQVARDLAAARSQVNLLLSGGEPADGTSPQNLAATLGLLRGDETLQVTEEDDARLERLETLLSAQDGSLSGDIVQLLRRAELQTLSVDIAGFQAEREQLSEQLTTYDAQAEDLRRQIAELNLERARLERDVTSAQQAYTDVSTLEPIITYVTEITPTNARLLNRASVPTAPVAPRRVLNTALAVVITGILAVLFVFLREAVRAPDVVTSEKPSAA